MNHAVIGSYNKHFGASPFLYDRIGMIDIPQFPIAAFASDIIDQADVIRVIILQQTVAVSIHHEAHIGGSEFNAVKAAAAIGESCIYEPVSGGTGIKLLTRIPQQSHSGRHDFSPRGIQDIGAGDGSQFRVVGGSGSHSGHIISAQMSLPARKIKGSSNDQLAVGAGIIHHAHRYRGARVLHPLHINVFHADQVYTGSII